ncbi:hypothetical protein [Pedobacter sp. ASV28]|uniref:hypothetical protein n=1 Tax=Pedobacter sp. ASV28 TaxID=2795123 RepID=UPI0018EE1616|nr:hypothetical protein [Pedobacter sp. ASV28]
MKQKFKINISTIGIVAVIVIALIGGFYLLKLKQGSHSAASFVSLRYSWGVGDSLLNSYDSKTGSYAYLDKRDSLIKKNFKLRANNVIYLHSKINELGLLDIPSVLANKNANLKDAKVLRYEFEFVYDNQLKKIVYLTNYDQDPVIANKAMALQKVVGQTIDEAEERFTNR